MEPATKKQKTATTQECPVCMEIYKDARVLNCGHHFCCSCLQKISDNSPDNGITCPVCRAVTKDKVPDLPKFDANISAVCAFCVTPTRGTMTCFDCKIILCKSCGSFHAEETRQFGHQVAAISQHQFCKQHTTDFVIFECKTCKLFICALCLPSHKGHTKVDLATCGKHLQKKYKFEKLASQDRSNEEFQKQLVSSNSKTLKSTKDELKKMYHSLNGQIKTMKTKLEKSNSRMHTKLDAKIKNLEKIETEMEKFSTRKSRSLESLDKLSSGMSPADMITQYQELPQYRNFNWDIRKTKTLVSTMNRYMEASDLLQKVDACFEEAKFTEKLLCSSYRPLGPLKCLAKFDVHQPLTDLKFGLTKDTLVMRTTNKKHPIIVYDTSGVRKETVQADISTRCQGIAVDTKRNLFLLPKDDGTLVTMDTNGNFHQAGPSGIISPRALNGVAYCEGPDLYIVSSIAAAPHSNIPVTPGACNGDEGNVRGALYIVQPGPGGFIHQFAINHKFMMPYNVHAYQDNNDQCLVAVSDRGRNCVDLFSLGGELIHSFQSDTEKDQGGIQLTRPAGLTSDPAGRLLVCDGDRKDQGGIQLTRPAGLTSDPAGRLLVCDGDRRVVSLWLEAGKAKYVQLLKKRISRRKKKIKAPKFIDCDRVSRRLIVGYEDGRIHVLGEA